jgi:serine/threonine protein phosphatase 1
MRPRTLAIGDVHGCAAALAAVLSAVDPQPDDLVIPVGDYVDRGPDSAGVIATLFELGRRCHLIPIRGNHDQLMLDAGREEQLLPLWLNLGGDATLASYGGTLADIPAEHWHFLADTCVDSVETATHLFVHGGVVSDVPVERQPPDVLQWQRFPPAEPHMSGKVVVCGHTAQRDGRPRTVGHAICLDTDADGPDGWVTVLDVAAGRYWQANQRGYAREGVLVP